VYCSGLKYVYALSKWDDETTLILSREKTLLDYIYYYWYKFSTHLEKAPDAQCLQQSWQAFKIITSPDTRWYRTLGFKKCNKFLNRLRDRVQHSLTEWYSFKQTHHQHLDIFVKNTWYISLFVYKYYTSSYYI
jgi:hypothetical protein